MNQIETAKFGASVFERADVRRVLQNYKNKHPTANLTIAEDTKLLYSVFLVSGEYGDMIAIGCKLAGYLMIE